jgi:hypothetical protein
VAEAQKNGEECRHFATKRRSAAFIILGRERSAPVDLIKIQVLAERSTSPEE